MTIETERLRTRVATELERTRERTALLTSTVDDDDLVRQHSPLMSPLVWDLAHVGNQEELWLVRDVGGRDPVRRDIDELYDAFKHARVDRPALPLLNPAEARAYIRTVRSKVLDLLDTVPFEGRRLVEQGFAFGMIVQHEQQHAETMLATHQLREGAAVLHSPAPPEPVTPVRGEVFVPGGPFVMGTSSDPWALDNERPAHEIEVPPFVIDAAPVTNAEYLAFIDAGGYDDSRWWTPDGWALRIEANLTAPKHWRRDADGWHYTRFGVGAPIRPDEPVVHVCFHEAAAYARWAGRRLPTEFEWEHAARELPVEGNFVDTGAWAPRADARPAAGLRQMYGDVWEWTASPYVAYPGFRAAPGAVGEYNGKFMNGQYVLRGGSCASPRSHLRASYRNFFQPGQRWQFSGLRLAEDA